VFSSEVDEAVDSEGEETFFNRFGGFYHTFVGLLSSIFGLPHFLFV
jgi:hypothetical protein